MNKVILLTIFEIATKKEKKYYAPYHHKNGESCFELYHDTIILFLLVIKASW